MSWTLFEPFLKFWQDVPILLANLLGVGIICVGILRQRRLSNLLQTALAKNEHLSDQLFRNTEHVELYRTLVEDQGDIIMRRDLDNRILSANDAFLNLVASLENAPKHIIGERFELCGDISRLSASRAGQPLSYEQRIETSEGLRWIAFVEAPMLDDETGVLLYQLVGRDVTDRRLAEAASEAKSRFLATVSHEIRTPLNGVLGMAQLLEQTGVSAEQRTYIGAIRTSGEALLSLIEQILDFSRIEAGKFDIVNEPFDLHGLCESVVELLAPRAQGKGVEIALYIERDVAQTVIGDAARLRQVLNNLCGNAVKFTEKGGIGVRVLRDTDAKIQFIIEDTGIGIAKHRLGHIFEEFEQVDSSHEGTGLGLAISRKIIERLNGTISVTSKLKKGSVFSFSLGLPTQKGVEQKVIHADFLNKRALIVGKTPFECVFIAQKLAEFGFTPKLCATPELALIELAKFGTGQLGTDMFGTDLVRALPDVLIVDAALVQTDTGEAGRALANLARAAGIKTRIILLSPFERQEFEEQKFEQQKFGSPSETGFNAWLTKPVRTKSLIERLSVELGLAAPHVHVDSFHVMENDRHQVLLGQKILLAEDNEINALLAERQLTKAGAIVTVAVDGLEAVQIYEQHVSGFDVVLLDMRMPKLDGLSCFRRMKAYNEEQNIPLPRFIALTANAFTEDRAICLKAGFEAFLTKPLNLKVLVDVVGTTGGVKRQAFSA